MKKRTFLPECYILFVLLLLYLPIAVVVAYSFNDTKLFHWADRKSTRLNSSH